MHATDSMHDIEDFPTLMSASVKEDACLYYGAVRDLQDSVACGKSTIILVTYATYCNQDMMSARYIFSPLKIFEHFLLCEKGIFLTLHSPSIRTGVDISTLRQKGWLVSSIMDEHQWYPSQASSLHSASVSANERQVKLYNYSHALSNDHHSQVD